MTTQAEFAAQWRGLAELDDAEQVAAIKSKLTEVVGHAEQDLAAEVENMLEVEVNSDDPTMERLTRNRLRAWLEMPPDQVGTLSAAVQAARETLPGPSAMRSTMAAQAAVRDLERDEVIRLIDIAPSLQNAVAPEMLEAIQGLATLLDSDQVAPAAAAAPAARRPWWKFW